MATRAAVVVASDSVSAGSATDASGALAVSLLAAEGYEVEAATVVPDEAPAIAAAIREAEARGARVIVVTGGTGIGPRDVTPEALRSIADKELPGVGEAIRAGSRASLPHADLSRATAATVGRAFVLAAPGSPGGLRDALAVALPLARHAVGVMDGGGHRSASDHDAAPTHDAARSEPASAIRASAFDVADCERAVAHPSAGAIVSFSGVVRDHDDERGVVALTYEAHPDARGRDGRSARRGARPSRSAGRRGTPPHRRPRRRRPSVRRGGERGAPGRGLRGVRVDRRPGEGACADLEAPTLRRRLRRVGEPPVTTTRVGEEAEVAAAPTALVDRFGRVHRDLRVSLTDRCNLRCRYCMPADGMPWLASDTLLTSAELVQLVGVAASLGVNQVRLTGGEPLLRPDVVEVVSGMASLPRAPRLSLTTNALRLHALAQPLADAGLQRVNVSLDSLDRDIFARLTLRDRLVDTLAGIAAAEAAGFAPIKINAVIMRGVNDHEPPALLRWAADHGYQMRFIEQMPLDPQHGWTRDGMITRAEIVASLEAAGYVLTPRDGRGPAPAELFDVVGPGVCRGPPWASSRR